MWACKAPPGPVASDQAPGILGPPLPCRDLPQLHPEPLRCAESRA